MTSVRPKSESRENPAKGPMRVARFVGLLLTATLLLGIPGASAADDAPTLAPLAPLAPWTLDKDAEGIKVYTRPVAGSGIKEFKGIAPMPVGTDEVLALLRDSDNFKTWFPNTPESKLLGREGDITYQYSVMATPWPVSDRDNIFRAETIRDTTTGVVEIRITAAPEHHPEQRGRVRVQHARGSWKLEPVDATRTQVTFIMHLEPGGGIPEWMINARVVATPFEALTNMRAKLER